MTRTFDINSIYASNTTWNHIFVPFCLDENMAALGKRNAMHHHLQAASYFRDNRSMSLGTNFTNVWQEHGLLKKINVVSYNSGACDPNCLNLTGVTSCPVRKCEFKWDSNMSYRAVGCTLFVKMTDPIIFLIRMYCLGGHTSIDQTSRYVCCT